MVEASEFSRRLPYVFGGVLMALDFILFREDCAGTLAWDLFAVDVMLAMLPVQAGEGFRMPRAFMSALTALSVLSAAAVITFLGSRGCVRMQLSALVSVAGLEAFLIAARSLRKKTSALEYCSRAVFVLSVMLVLVALMETGASRTAAGTAFLYAAMSASVACLAVRTRLPKVQPVTVELPTTVPSVFPQGTTGSIADSMDEKARMDTLFDRVDSLMTEDKLFLDEDLTLGDVSNQLSCNKVYVSRAILDKTGYNFRQYINRYRIEYGLEILKQDPDIKLSELSSLCGFHSQPTFNLAFRLTQRQTPSEWKKEFRGEEPETED